MKRRGVITVGFVFIVLFIITSSTASSVVYNESKREIAVNETAFCKSNKTYVDPNINLTKVNLPTLKKALQFINSSKNVKFVQEIIKTIEQKGYANSKDIKEIVSKLNLGARYVYSGIVAAAGVGYTTCIPGEILMLYASFFVTPLALFIVWQDISLKGGCAIGFVGIFSTSRKNPLLPYVDL